MACRCSCLWYKPLLHILMLVQASHTDVLALHHSVHSLSTAAELRGMQAVAVHRHSSAS